PKPVKHKRGNYAAHAARKPCRARLRIEDSQRALQDPLRRFDRVVTRSHELDLAVPRRVSCTLIATQCDVMLDGGGRRGRKPPVEKIHKLFKCGAVHCNYPSDRDHCYLARAAIDFAIRVPRQKTAATFIPSRRSDRRAGLPLMVISVRSITLSVNRSAEAS